MSVGSVLAGPAVQQLSAAVPAYTLTTGRLVASVAALVALAGVVVGGLALARSAGRTRIGPRRRGATVALVSGLTGMAVGALVVAVADGGPGSGSGIVGGFAALVLGLTATLLGRLALSRSRRTV
jgi:hypothetical protein